MRTLVRQEHVLEEIDVFLKESLITEKKNMLTNILVYNDFLHPEFIGDRHFPKHTHNQNGLSLCCLSLGHINTF